MKVVVNHETGDVVLHAVNGDPILRFHKDGPFVVFNSGPHILDAACSPLTPEAIEAISDFCESVKSSPHQPKGTAAASPVRSSAQ